MTAISSSTKIRRRFMIAAVYYPGLLLTVALIIQITLLPHLPDPIAIHWGSQGQANGFASPLWTILLTLIIGAGVPLAIAASLLPDLSRGLVARSYQFMGAISAGTSTLICTVMTWTLLIQKGAADSNEVRLEAWPILVLMAVSVGVGALAWFLQPRETAALSSARPVAPLDLHSQQNAVWLQETSLSGVARAVIVVATIGVTLSAVGTWFLQDDRLLTALLAATALALALALAAAATVIFRARVDKSGISVASVLSFLRFRVPMADIASVGVVQVNPISEFGGMGLRTIPGKFGIILRAGPAIEVTRKSGRKFVVTVSHADQGAALLQALLNRAQQ